jgi:hypothetical protein
MKSLSIKFGYKKLRIYFFKKGTSPLLIGIHQIELINNRKIPQFGINELTKHSPNGGFLMFGFSSMKKMTE